jgi:hypothetical protein
MAARVRFYTLLLLNTLQVSLISYSSNTVINILIEIAKCFGDGLKVPALQKQFSLWVNPTAKLIREAVDRGYDPARVVMITEKCQPLA